MWAVLEYMTFVGAVLILGFALLAIAYELSKTYVVLGRRFLRWSGWFHRTKSLANGKTPKRLKVVVRVIWAFALIVLVFDAVMPVTITTLPSDILSRWNGKVNVVVAAIGVWSWLLFITQGIVLGIADGLKSPANANLHETPGPPRNVNEPPAAAEPQGPKAPLRLRWILAALMAFLLSVMVLALVPRDEVSWRAVGILAGGIVSLVVGLRLRTKVQPPEETPSILPAGLEEPLAALVSHAVEHADRSSVAWATITVTAHSLIALALAKVGRPEDLAEVARTMTIYGVAMLVLASITLPGAHAVSTSAERARRAVAEARRHPIIGPLYSRVYQDEPPVWQTDLLGITMTAFGTAWLWFGFLLLALGTLFSVV